MTVWFDLTNTLYSWKGNVVGIVRVELSLAKEMLDTIPELEFTYFDGKRFVKVDFDKTKYQSGVSFEELFESIKKKVCGGGRHKKEKSKNSNLFEELSPERKRMIKEGAKSVLSTLPFPFDHISMKVGRRLINFRRKLLTEWNRKVPLKFSSAVLKNSDFSKEILFKDGDVFFSCGWITSGKEVFLSEAKKYFDEFKIIYLVYDTVILDSRTKPFYRSSAGMFKEYLKWVSRNCDYVIYWGNNAKKDVESFFAEHHLHIPSGSSIHFSSSLRVNAEANLGSLESVSNKNYILTVGTVEPRKNYRVLYEAYCSAALNGIDLPDLIIAGSAYSQYELISEIKENPLIKGKIRIVSPNDEELEELYNNCSFFVLPSLYEGWSLTLAEALSHGKFCLCSDVPPLREVGNGFAAFVDPYSPRTWLESICFYNNPENRLLFEQKVKLDWNCISWKDWAKDITEKIYKVKDKEKKLEYPNFYFDLSFFFYEGSMTGIPRTEFRLAREIVRIIPTVKFFAFINGKFITLSHKQLENIIGETLSIQKAVLTDRANFSRNTYTSPINEASSFSNLRQGVKLLVKGIFGKSVDFLTLKTGNTIPAFELPFEDESVVFSAGVGFEELFYSSLKFSKTKRRIKFIQLIYDYTPIIVPHTHVAETIQSYNRFLPQSYTHADYLLFGGQTAADDGIEHQKKLGFNPKKYGILKFGSDLFLKKDSNILASKEPYENGNSFILCVGTIQARKNQIILYEAYLNLLNRPNFAETVPDLILCGYSGWKNENLLSLISCDERLKGKIRIINPSDEELEILYANSLFTVLPSLYEGWSLTLPESLGRGKFCIASDTKPLKEIGGDLIDYADPYDPDEWANKIIFYATNKNKLKEKEDKIKENWKDIKWSDTAAQLSEFIKNC